MAYVSVPKDLTKVKNKVAFNLTRRQIICFGTAGAVGIPFYFLTRNVAGDSAAMMGMVIIMIPAFLFAMYEKDGMPLETVLMNIITVRYKRPQVRRYETENMYEYPGRAAPVEAKGHAGRNAHASGKADVAYGAPDYGRNLDGQPGTGRFSMRDPRSRMDMGEGRPAGGAGAYAGARKGGMDRARQGW